MKIVGYSTSLSTSLTIFFFFMWSISLVLEGDGSYKGQSLQLHTFSDHLSSHKIVGIHCFADDSTLLSSYYCAKKQPQLI